MIWGWFRNYYWLCYKCLGREIQDTSRPQLTPPNVRVCVLPGGWETVPTQGTNYVKRKLIATVRYLLRIYIDIYWRYTYTYIHAYIYTHTYVCVCVYIYFVLTSHNSEEGRGQTHFFPAVLTAPKLQTTHFSA